jgi:hypothetical protein
MDLLAVIAVVVCVVSSVVLGARLLAMSVRSRAPTGMLAIALLFGAGPALLFGLLLSAVDTRPATAYWELVHAGYLISAAIGSVSVMRFAYEVYHPESRALPWLTASVAVYFAVAASAIPFAEPIAGREPERLLGLGSSFLLFAIFAWTSGESFRYWRIYRRVSALDPVVVRRFRLWGIATAAVIPVVAFQVFARNHPIGQTASACFGLTSVVALWLAFLPPRRYRRRLANSPGRGSGRGA